MPNGIFFIFTKKHRDEKNYNFGRNDPDAGCMRS